MRALLAVGIAIVLVTGCVRPTAMSAASAPQLYTPAAEPEVSPPSLVTPTPPKRTRSYAAKMVALDLLLFVTAIPMVSWVEEDVGQEQANALGAAYIATYALAPAWIHSFEGNHDQVGRSVGRRLGYPVLGGLAGLGVTGALMDFECDGELCFLAYLYGAIIGGGVGAVVAAVLDWGKAKVSF